MNIIQRFITAITPKRHYIEAGSHSPPMQVLKRARSGVNLAASASTATIRERARALYINNVYARSGASVLVSNLIGEGHKPTFGIQEGATLSPSVAQQIKRYALVNKAEIERIERLSGKDHTKFLLLLVKHLWQKHMESTDIDSTGIHNIYSLQRLAVQGAVIDGESFLLHQSVKRSDQLSLPFQLCALEPEYLCEDPRSKTPQGHSLYGGIEIDGMGKRKAYWLYSHHPREDLLWDKENHIRRVPADKIAHLFRTDRAGQIRGISWLAPVLVRIQDLESFDGATIKRQRVSAAFAGFIQNAPPGFIEELTGGEFHTEIEAGSITALPEGTTITFSPTPTFIGYNEYARINLRAIAKGLNIPYSEFSSDYSESNYSSSRLDYLGFDRELKAWRSTLIKPLLLDPIQRWFLEGCESIGIPTSLITTHWVPPRRGLVDPEKEIKGLKEEIQGGLVSYSEAVTSLGRNPEQVLSQMATDKQSIESKGLYFDTLFKEENEQQQKPNQ